MKPHTSIKKRDWNFFDLMALRNEPTQKFQGAVWGHWFDRRVFGFGVYFWIDRNQPWRNGYGNKIEGRLFFLTAQLNFWFGWKLMKITSTLGLNE